jgi:hypothetical protein
MFPLKVYYPLLGYDDKDFEKHAVSVSPEESIRSEL